MTKPLISVIVPIYKVEPYLRRCVDSIINQTYQNLEIILVDDGSPDNCGAICDEYAARDHRIRVIHKKNGGPSDARNAGMDIARGEYLAFVDSDDYIATNYILELVNNMPYDLSISGYTSFYAQDDIQQVFPATNIPKIFDDGLDFKTLKSLIASSHWGYAWLKLYKRSTLEGLRFSNIPFREDLLFNLEVLKRSERIYLSPLNGYFYLQREGSLLHRQYNQPVPPILSTARKMAISCGKYTSKQNQTLSEIMIIGYLTDMISTCILRNNTLSANQKLLEIKSIFADREFRKIINISLNRNRMLNFFALCYKFNLPTLYYLMMRFRSK